MRISGERLEASYGWCRRTARRSRSNFYACFLGLPRAKRRATEVLYAFMRHTDDLADNAHSVELRRTALANWRAALQGAVKRQFDPPIRHQAPHGPTEAPDDPSGGNLLPALADVVERFRIPVAYLSAVIDGVEMDLRKRRYETFEELRAYCERVASAVGLACIHVWGFRGREALEPARKSGIALQLTNILRDLKEDAAADRVYLPVEDLRQCGYSVDELKRGVEGERFCRLMELQIGRAERFYREGAELMRWLKPAGRRTFGMMMATYRSLLEKIKRRPADVLRCRVCLSRPEKLQIALRWTLLPPRAAALL